MGVAAAARLAARAEADRFSGRLDGPRRNGAQQQLRDALEFSRAEVLDEPRVLVREAFMRFDADGRLVEDSVRAELAELLDALVAVAGGVTLAA